MSCKESDDFKKYKEIETVPGKSSAPGPGAMGLNHPPINMPAPAQVSDFRKAQEGDGKSEITGDANVTPPSGSDLTWEAPSGWQEVAGSGMRTVTFVIQENAKQLECTVVKLPGQAGGLASNVDRWLGQLGIRMSSDEKFKTFLEEQQKVVTKDKSEGVIIDMTTLLGSDMTSDQSGLAAIIDMNNTTVFVKLFGSKPVLKANKEKFIQLTQSLSMK